MRRTGMRVSPIYVLLAVALGALAAAGWFALTATTPQPAGGVASARVLATAPCTGSGRDTLSVAAPAGPVTTTLDGCGRSVGTTLTVEINADGTVPNPAALVGTRAERARSPLPLGVVGACAVLVLGLGVGVLRGPSARAAQQG
ncbi:MAG: hypothetical protein ABI251_09235 [Mycobacteriaceae bacterium]